MRLIPRLLVAALCLSPLAAQAEDDPARLYTQHCAACHGGDRLGAIGPALIPDNLGRMKKAEAERVIAQGRPATNMEGFADRLGADEIAALAGYIFSPLAQAPEWGLAQMRASHVKGADSASLPKAPPFASDPLNLFTVVEAGDHHVTVLDGDRMEPLARFATRFAVHGGAKYSPDGRFVYLASRDGWVSKYDMWTGAVLAEIRVGINTRNIAVSHDGRLVLAGNGLPNTLVMLDAGDLTPLAVIPVQGEDKTPSRVSAVYDAPPRASFIVALKDIKEIWEIPYGKGREPVYHGFVHNHEAGMAEGLADRSLFPARHIRTEEVLDDFFFDPGYRNIIGAARDGKSGQVINLVTGQRIATLPLPGMPHLGSGITFTWQGRPVLATPHLKEAAVSFIDMSTWHEIKRLPTCGGGFFMRGHENSPYAWVDCSLGQAKDSMQVIDTRTLEIVKTITPEPGRALGHAEFTRDGRFVLLSVMERDGALLVADADSFAVVKRLPMVHPVGKYNVFNKITLSAGTSH
ncbi:MAG: nitrite reductase [Magnetospirillum sp.]|nr:nitrite reductase [Magnetospirillum sp.]